MTTGAAGQQAFFDDDTKLLIAEGERRDRALWEAQQRRFEVTLAAILADTAAWKGGPFSDRVEALLGSLVALGEPGKGMHDAILSGINSAANAGRLDEKHVAFVEGKARQEVARLGSADQIVPVPWRERDTTDLAKMGAGLTQLPEQLQTAALTKINALGNDLASKGFASSEEVDARAPRHVRNLADQMREVYTALSLLSSARYRSEKAYKNVNPGRLDDREDFATSVLGINTRDFPGIKMDLSLTSDGRLRTTEGRAPRRIVSPDEAVSRAQPADAAAGFYVGKIITVTADGAVQKFGRRPGDLVAHDLQQLADADGLAPGEVVTVSYAMGVGQVSGRNRGMERQGVDR